MYHEQRRVWWIWLIVFPNLLCMASFAWGLWGLVTTGWGDRVDSWGVLALLGVIIVLMWLLTIAFAGYLVEFDGQQLTFGFQHWHVRVAASEIAGARRQQIGWLGWNFGGFGWRFDLARRFGYIVSGGAAVEVTTKRGRVYVFSCSDPDALLAGLQEAGVGRQG